MNQKIDDAENNVSMYIQQGFHCSEAFVKGMGVLFPEIKTKELTRFASGFGGGIGNTKQEVCGLLVGGVLIISSLLGRSELHCKKNEIDEQDKKCQEICAEFRMDFLDKVKATRCCEIRMMGYGGIGIPCSTLSKDIASIFVGVCQENCLLNEQR